MDERITGNIDCSKYNTFSGCLYLHLQLLLQNKGIIWDIVLFGFRLKELGNISVVSTATRQRLQSQCDVVLDKPTYFMKLDAGKVYTQCTWLFSFLDFITIIVNVYVC